MARVLVIDGEPAVRETIEAYLDGLGYASVPHERMAGAVELAENEHCDLVLLAHELPDGRGTDIIPRLKLVSGHPEIIIMLRDEDGDGFEVARRYGAWDHIRKPLLENQFGPCLSRALKYRDGISGKERREPMTDFKIAGSGSEIKRTLSELLDLAAGDRTVLVSGEKGTMKSVYAKRLHEESPRRKQPFVIFDCLSLPPDLAQSMFAVENGDGRSSFSAGIIDKVGRGSLFMKNIEALPRAAHETILRMQREPSARREMGVDFRLIASTDKNLKDLNGYGIIPKPLAELLAANKLRIPPLRRRKEDIPEMASRLLLRKGFDGAGDVKGMSAEFLRALMQYSWPGNDAELASVLDRVCLFSSRQPMLLPEHLPESMGGSMCDRESPDAMDMFPTYREHRESMLSGAERSYLIDVIELSKGNHKKAEAITGLSRSRLYELLSKYGLTFKSVSGKKK
jgi:two-component system NtrC family response regulator